MINAKKRKQGQVTVRYDPDGRNHGLPGVRISKRNQGKGLLLSITDLFNLTELLDDLCDEIEDKEEASEGTHRQ